jgi:hypothetical protein
MLFALLGVADEVARSTHPYVPDPVVLKYTVALLAVTATEGLPLLRTGATIGAGVLSVKVKEPTVSPAPALPPVHEICLAGLAFFV